MLDTIFEIIFLVGLVIYFFGVYTPHARHYKKQKTITDWYRTRDIVLDFSTYVVWQIIPVVYIFTSWLDFADYSIPYWTGWIGGFLFVGSLLLLWRAYYDLGRNWSPTLQIVEEHLLVTKGIYKYLRHPIYAGLFLWGVAQPLLLHNWIAGGLLLVFFTVLYVVRVPLEEEMMIQEFGKEYTEYMKKTGGIIPKVK
ncbi:MAG: protein-S-isoprenylcysteine O-methyltransferase [Candidatus Methanofastidiosia archaeon]|jgi:protein-S-isoprenylcysteine O-methyltransferase Ste14